MGNPLPNILRTQTYLHCPCFNWKPNTPLTHSSLGCMFHATIQQIETKNGRGTGFKRNHRNSRETIEKHLNLWKFWALPSPVIRYAPAGRIMGIELGRMMEVVLWDFSLFFSVLREARQNNVVSFERSMPISMGPLTYSRKGTKDWRRDWTYRFRDGIEW